MIQMLHKINDGIMIIFVIATSGLYFLCDWGGEFYVYLGSIMQLVFLYCMFARHVPCIARKVAASCLCAIQPVILYFWHFIGTFYIL